MSDGEHQAREDWGAALDELRDRSWKFAPEVVAFGFGNATNTDVLRRIATRFSFLARDADPAVQVPRDHQRADRQHPDHVDELPGPGQADGLHLEAPKEFFAPLPPMTLMSRHIGHDLRQGVVHVRNAAAQFMRVPASVQPVVDNDAPGQARPVSHCGPGKGWDSDAAPSAAPPSVGGVETVASDVPLLPARLRSCTGGNWAILGAGPQRAGATAHRRHLGGPGDREGA